MKLEEAMEVNIGDTVYYLEKDDIVTVMVTETRHILVDEYITDCTIITEGCRPNSSVHYACLYSTKDELKEFHNMDDASMLNRIKTLEDAVKRLVCKVNDEHRRA